MSLRPSTRHALFTLLALCAVSTLRAQATRTWVSGVGDDANPCSRTAPCKTFAGAISKTAAGGEISVLDPGGFGGVTITKSITISGTGVISSVLVASGNGINVSAGANDIVILRDLSITGLGAGGVGVRFNSGKELHIEHCQIEGFTSAGILAAPAPAAGTIASLFVSDTSIRSGTSASAGTVITPYGLDLSATGGRGLFATLDRVRIESVQNGLRAGDLTNVSIRQSTITHNSAVGIIALPGANGADVMVEESTISGNATGVQTNPGGSVRTSHSTYTANTLAFDFSAGGAVVSFGDNRVTANGGGQSFSSTVAPS